MKIIRYRFSLLITFFCILFQTVAQGQENIPDPFQDTTIYSIKDLTQIFRTPDEDQLLRYFMDETPIISKLSEFIYVTDASKFFFEIIIERNGYVSSMHIINNEGLPDLTKELTTLAQKLNKLEGWQPGKIHEKTVRSSYIIPLQICLR